MLRWRKRPRIVRPVVEEKPKKCSRVQAWTNIFLSALVPLMIGVATIVIAIGDESREEKRREQDQHLAFLTRLQDRQLADELYFQNVFKTYIEDVSNVLFKSTHSFIDENKKVKYIRAKTLTALDELDAQRKSRLFLFLDSTGLLSTNATNISLDLSGANFTNIWIHSTSYKKYSFNQLSLSSVALTNASFINCEFTGGVDFSDSFMFGVNFTGSKFHCSENYTGFDNKLGRVHVKFVRSNLESSDFTSCHVCDSSFNRANFAYGSLKRVKLQGMIEFEATNMTEINRKQTLYDMDTAGPLFMSFSSVDFRTIPADMSILNSRHLKLTNVILLNGTWILNETNLLLNGDAESSCANARNGHALINWEINSLRGFLPPTISEIQWPKNSTYGRCCFNFTVTDKRLGMEQVIDVTDYTVFIITDEALFELSADVRCTRGAIGVEAEFYDSTSTSFNMTQLPFAVNESTTWQKKAVVGKIPSKTHRMRITLERHDKGECSIDNIRLRIHQRKPTTEAGQ